MTRLAVLAFGFALGVAVERYRHDWRASDRASRQRDEWVSERIPPAGGIR